MYHWICSCVNTCQSSLRGNTSWKTFLNSPCKRWLPWRIRNVPSPTLTALAVIQDWTHSKSFLLNLWSQCKLILPALCVDHVIWKGRRILKLALKFEMFVHFLVFCWIKKKDAISLFTLPIAKILSVKNAPAWVLMVFT